MEKGMSITSKLALVGVVFAILAAVTFGTSAKSASADGPCTIYNYNVLYGQPYMPPCVNPGYPGYPIGPLTCGVPYRPPCFTPNIQIAPNNCGGIYLQPYAAPCMYPGYPLTNCGGYAGLCNVPYFGGVPQKMNLAVSPAITTCGVNPVTVSANVTDAYGVPVPNGTAVSYSSTIGVIGSAATIGGNATAILSVPVNSPAGVAVIRVTAGNATSTTTVQVNCAPQVQQVIVVAQQPAQPYGGTVIYRPAPVQQQPAVIVQRPRPQPVAPYIPPFAPPRTGEVGLADPANLVLADDSAADQALVSAWSESQYGVLDASQYDWVVTPDDSNASVQLAQDLLDQAYGVIDASQVDAVIVADDSAATTTLVIDVAKNPTDYGDA